MHAGTSSITPNSQHSHNTYTTLTTVSRSVVNAATLNERELEVAGLSAQLEAATVRSAELEALRAEADEKAAALQATCDELSAAGETLRWAKWTNGSTSAVHFFTSSHALAWRGVAWGARVAAVTPGPCSMLRVPLPSVNRLDTACNRATGLTWRRPTSARRRRRSRRPTRAPRSQRCM